MGASKSSGTVMVTVANRLTIFRFGVIPFFWICFLSSEAGIRAVATGLFIVGALTDLIDGKLARSRREVTAFGDFMDPLADKLLVLSAFWGIILREPLGEWRLGAGVMVALITLREALLTAMRIWGVVRRRPVVTSIWGKLKTAVQLVAIISILVAGNLRDWAAEQGAEWAFLSDHRFTAAVGAMVFLSLFSSWASAAEYIRAVRKSGAGK